MHKLHIELKNYDYAKLLALQIKIFFSLSNVILLLPNNVLLITLNINVTKCVGKT